MKRIRRRTRMTRITRIFLMDATVCRRKNHECPEWMVATIVVGVMIECFCLYASIQTKSSHHSTTHTGQTIPPKNLASLENTMRRVGNLWIPQFFVVFRFVLQAVGYSKMAGKGCRACSNRTWNGRLEWMLVEHAAQSVVFMVFVFYPFRNLSFV